jgi:hypothetical protein
MPAQKPSPAPGISCFSYHSFFPEIKHFLPHRAEAQTQGLLKSSRTFAARRPADGFLALRAEERN